MLAYGEGKHEVSLEHVKYAVNDTEATRGAVMNRYMGWAVAASTVVFLTVSMVVMWQTGGGW